jgi:hypothetical protein
MYYVGSRGYYWASLLYSSNAIYGYYMSFYSSGVYWQNYNFDRYFGFSLRGVVGE